MSKSAFEQFLGARKEPTSAAWAARRAQWLQAVDDLYDQVAGWLDEYVQAMAVDCQRKPRELVEEDLGRYPIDALQIRCQGVEVVLEPIGANIIGALGRADLVGPAGSVCLLLVPPDRRGPRISIRHAGAPAAEARPEPEPTPVFKLATDPPKVEYLDLDQDLFLEALLYVMGARVQSPGE